MKRTVLGFLAVMGISVSAFADAMVSEYRLERYPKDSGNCHEVALALGETFARATGKEVVESICNNISESGFDITVRFRTNEPFPLVTTAPKGTIASIAVFKTEAACRSLLASEAAHFTKVTGLTPTAAFCFEEKSSSKDPWVLRVDGFGDAKVRPQVASGFLFGKILGWTLTPFLKAVQDGFTKEGVDARFVTLRSSLAYGELMVMGYTAEKLRVVVKEVAKVKSQPHCETALLDVQQIFKGYRPGLAHSFCAYTDITGNYEVTVVFPFAESLLIRPAAEEAASYQACEQARPALLEYYKVKLKRPVVGGVCSYENQRWTTMLFEEHP